METEIAATVSTFDPASLSVVWILVLSFIIAFFLAFGVGANDVANSFGTSVGSKVLTLRQACLLATIFEIAGAISLGHGVSNTIRTGMIYIDQYESEQKLLMLGYLSALFGASVWNIFATICALPVSGTHSIVGAIIGFAVVAKGFDGVKWSGLIRIVASWFISPVMSGVVSLLIYLLIRYFIISSNDSLNSGLRALPIFYAITIFINVFSIINGGPKIFSSLTWWAALLIGLLFGFVIGLIVWFYVVPKLKKRILDLLNSSSLESTKESSKSATKIEMSFMEKPNGVENGKAYSENHVSEKDVNTENLNQQTKNQTNGKNHAEIGVNLDSNDTKSKLNNNTKSTVIEDNCDDDKPEVAQLFTFLQILTACFGSFAHGGNDVSNAIGPLVAVMMIYRDGNQNGETPWYILLYGGVAISIGLWVWGRKVIKTMGQDLTKITPSTGFTIEIGSAITVLLATKLGLPVSTTHCKVGSVVMVGKASKSKQGVNWRLFGSISAAWILTVPVTALFSAFAMWLLKFTL